MMMLVIRILSSWFPDLQDHPILRFIRFYTDPYLNIFRRFIPPLGMFDLSPLVAFFALQLLENFVKGFLLRL
jgi:YggT family protein